MAKTKDFRNDLHQYLKSLNDNSKNVNHESLITARTSIDSTELSKLKLGYTSRFAAKKFFEIHLAIKRPIEEMIDCIYPSVTLPDKPQKEFTKKRSELSNILFGSFTEEEIEYKTGIAKKRLKNILEDNEVIILTSELILIELATKRKKGSLFKQLFKKVTIKK